MVKGAQVVKLMMVCPTCNGSCWVKDNRCTDCTNGLTSPPQQILDDLECAEIERGFITKFKDKAVFVYYEFGHWNVAIPYTEGYKKYFEGSTKLEALRKAKEYLDGRNA